jgi:hypothetical protein
MPGSSRGERRIPPEYCEVGASGIGSIRHAIMSPVVRNSVVNVTVNVLSVPMVLLAMTKSNLPVRRDWCFGEIVKYQSRLTHKI